LLDEWLRIAGRLRDSAVVMGYQTKADGTTRGLLQKPASRDAPDNYLYTCLNSLRDVEPNVDLVLNDND